MYKFIKKKYKYIFIFIILFVTELLFIDMHFDGVLLRNRWYIIRPAEKDDYQMDVYYGIQQQGINVGMLKIGDGVGQTFYIENTEDNLYKIMFGNENFCVSVDNDGYNVVIEKYEGKNSQLWKINRVNNSDSFYINNLEYDRMITYDYIEEVNYYTIVVKDYKNQSELNEFRMLIQ